MLFILFKFYYSESHECSVGSDRGEKRIDLYEQIELAAARFQRGWWLSGEKVVQKWSVLLFSGKTGVVRPTLSALYFSSKLSLGRDDFISGWNKPVVFYAALFIRQTGQYGLNAALDLPDYRSSWKHLLNTRVSNLIDSILKQIFIDSPGNLTVSTQLCSKQNNELSLLRSLQHSKQYSLMGYPKVSQTLLQNPIRENVAVPLQMQLTHQDR